LFIEAPPVEFKTSPRFRIHVQYIIALQLHVEMT